MFSAVIIDDEARVRETIQHMLSIYCPNIKVIGEADSVESGYTLIDKIKPEVVFLDIKMPDGTGFDLLKRFKRIDFYLIIITSYEEYAIQAFKVSALDYILKPVDSTDLINAVIKLTKVINSEDSNLKFETYLSNIESNKNESKKIVLKTQDNVYVVNINDIIRCESKNNYTLFYLVDKSTVLVSKTLKEFDEMLSPMSFIRCHQTHLANLRHILKFIKHPNYSLIMTDGITIPVSVRKKETIENLFKNRQNRSN
jgi:two-component system, LytTR family, response regulator